MDITVSQEAREAEVTQADREAVAEFHRQSFKTLFTTTDADIDAGINRSYELLCQAFARHRQSAERGETWRPIDDCPMWELAIVTDGENVAKAQKAECDYGGFYWSIEPEDALEWEPTHWMPFDTLPTPPEARA